MRYIAIDGPGGSGKTHLANLLADRLNARVFHLDEFGNDYEPFVGIPTLVEALRDTQNETIIFEGVGVFDDRFAAFNAYRIFVDTPADIRKARATRRDVPTVDRSADEWRKIYDIWKAAEASYFTETTREKADLIVGEDGNFDIEAIASRL